MVIALIVIAVIVLGLIGFVVAGFNKLRTTDVGVEEALGGIDVQLTRRADLIPNLVETVKGYAAHEKGVFEEVTRARAGVQEAASGDDVAAKAAADAQLDRALVDLIAVAENYPDLKANANFIELQEQLAETENQLAFARQYYNDAVATLNKRDPDGAVDVLRPASPGCTGASSTRRRPGRTRRRRSTSVRAARRYPQSPPTPRQAAADDDLDFRDARPGNQCRRRCSRTRSPSWAARTGRASWRWPRRSPTSMESGRHLLVQAGTGTGKSLGYLVPAILLHEPRGGRHRDARAAAPAGRARHPGADGRGQGPVLESEPSYAVLKGRSNYACLHRVREGVPDDQGALVDAARGVDGRGGRSRCATWAEEEADAARHRRPRHRPAAHRAGLARRSRVSHRECLGPPLRLRRRVLRRARQGARRPRRRRGHQPLAARDRRDRGRPDDPGVRRRGRRRGPRAGRPG